MEFLKMNRNLKRISGLPEASNSLTEDFARQFLSDLPKDLIQFEIADPMYFAVQRDLLKVYKDLKVIQLTGAVRPAVLHLDGVKSRNVQVFENCLIKNIQDIKLVVNAFPCLAHLKLKISRTMFSGNIFQSFEKYSECLVSLNLEFQKEDTLTDFDVTGLYKKDLTLYEKSSLEALRKVKITDKDLIGVPFHALRRKKQLYF
jgi:hypothetical protein